MKSLAIPLAFLSTGCGGDDDEPTPKEAPRQIVIIQQVPAPSPPQVPAALPKPPPPTSQPMMGTLQQPMGSMSMRTMPIQQPFVQPLTQQPDLRQAQIDLLTKYQGVYADYAAGVTKLEQETTHLAAKNYTHRQRFYWLPLNKFSEQLQSQFQINGYQLAQIVTQGLAEAWPTQSTRNAASVTRMFRRIRAEQKLAARHAEAVYSMACLDALCNSIIAAGTAAGTALRTALWAVGLVAVNPLLASCRLSSPAPEAGAPTWMATCASASE